MGKTVLPSLKTTESSVHQLCCILCVGLRPRDFDLCLVKFRTNKVTVVQHVMWLITGRLHNSTTKSDILHDALLKTKCSVKDITTLKSQTKAMC